MYRLPTEEEWELGAAGSEADVTLKVRADPALVQWARMVETQQVCPTWWGMSQSGSRTVGRGTVIMGQYVAVPGTTMMNF